MKALALTLRQRLSLLLAALLVAFGAAAAWLHAGQMKRHGQQLQQQWARPLGAQVSAELAASVALPAQPSVDSALKALAPRFLAAYPGVELYVLDAAGRIASRQPQTRPLRRASVELAPVQALLAGDGAPVLGDDPLDPVARVLFSAAMYRPDERASGYVYAVLRGEADDAALAEAANTAALRQVLWPLGVLLPAGLLALAHTTAPLTRGGGGAAARQGHGADEQDQRQHEWMLAVSHELRTPLASVRGYLETLLMPAVALSGAEREQVLRAALAQCLQLSARIAQRFELARLEGGAVKPNFERFSMVELVSDVMQKLALGASSRQRPLVSDFGSGTLDVLADIGMIEQVVTSLIDSAIRQPAGAGEVCVRLRLERAHVHLEVGERGTGFVPTGQARPCASDAMALAGDDGGGLALAIAQQLLKLHGSGIVLHDGLAGRTVRAFQLPAES